MRLFFLGKRGPIFIDPRRVNDEVRAERRVEAEGDVAYRQKVKQRMVEGYSCKLPPLIDATVWRQRELRPKVTAIKGGKR